MQAQQLIHKAAALLDLREDQPGAVIALQQAIAVADDAGATIPGIEARVFLAEVLLLRPGSETSARGLLHAALALGARFTDDPDLVRPLLRKAEELLSGMNASSP